MKKLLFLCIMAFALAFSVNAQDVAIDLVDTVQMEEPNTTVAEVIAEIPDNPEDAMYWIISIIVLVLYELVFRFIPTSKSVSIIGVIYRLLNAITLGDKSKDGKKHKIRPF